MGRVWGELEMCCNFQKEFFFSSEFSKRTFFLYVEIVGTAFGCWKWQPAAFGLIPTFNPPVGAFACYILGELGAMRAARMVSPLLKARLRLKREF